MSESPVVRGVTHKWGTTDAEIGFLLDQIANQFTRRKAGSKTEVKDGKGNTVSVVYFDNRVEVNFDVLIKVTDGVTEPERGDIIALYDNDGTTTANYLVDDPVTNWKAGETVSMTISATYYPNVVL